MITPCTTRRASFALAALLLTVPSLHAQDEAEAPQHHQLIQYDQVCITLHSGATYSIPISAGSQIQSYNTGDDTFVIDVKGDDCFYTFRRDEVRTITFAESADQTGIREIQSTPSDYHASLLRIADGFVQLHPSLQGQTCYVCNLMGHVVRTFTVEAPYSLSLEEFHQGGYVITVGSNNLKILKP